MNVNVSIPLVSCLIHLTLFVVTLSNKIPPRIKLSFGGYLFVTALWSLSAFLLHGNFFPEETLLIHRILLGLGFFVPITYFFFASCVTQIIKKPLIYLAFSLYLIVLVLDISGFTMTSSRVVDYIVYYEKNFIYCASYVITVSFAVLGLFLLLNKIRTSKDAIKRKQIMLLSIGVGVIILLSFTVLFDPISRYPIDHIGNIFGAVITLYAILKYNVLDIKISLPSHSIDNELPYFD